ncbi:MAG TPA: 6-phosphogluconolactonase [Mesorhizobium sp.]|jgi:6-phosphogluconolactonase|nr:6-phosphogluconolactonase [Mesorhizobium sp.]
MSEVPVESYRWQAFPSRETLAAALAAETASSLQAAVRAKGHGLLAVSGGATPELFFGRLAQQPIDWDPVVVTLCDERFVEPSSPRSNEGLARRALLQGSAAQARFVPLFRPTATAEEAARQAATAFAALPLPLDVAVLGMGEDGHTASFFPDSPDLERALDPQGAKPVMVMRAPSAGEPRLTLTLPVLAKARRLILHIEGDKKREAFDRALRAEPPSPVRAVIEQAERPVEVFWAP